MAKVRLPFDPMYPPIPWPVRSGRFWRGYWGPDVVGPGISNRFRAMLPIFFYRLQDVARGDWRGQD